MENLRSKKGFLCDMDGVIYHGNQLLPGVKEFVAWLQREEKRFLFLTNSSERSPRELAQKLSRMGMDVDESHFYTSALATAKFVASQSPGCTAYVIGAPGLLNALYEAGITMNDVNPDYVIVGETSNYNYESILKAVHFVQKGARLIGTNTDMTGPSEKGIIPACRALVSPIELTTGCSAYYVGKPNPLMMRTGLKLLGCHSGEAVMVGDRMDTDIVAGVETGLDTVLVLSGVTTPEMMNTFPYRPHYVLSGVGEICPEE
ncbi:MAG: HAD family hydrolase [Clostridia bacterium]|nr:HAD family hydrolase [Clostridia bacterium]MBQ6805220.1 HAD family hydrolase [Clostridia bacterium]